MSDWREEYKVRYAKLKAEGKSFFPYAVFKDLLVAVLILVVLSVLAWKIGAGLEPLADPTDTTYNPRPEWYFLFIFQALKAFPGSMESVAAVLLPGLAVIFLLVLPLIDRGPRRHPLDRPFLTGFGIVVLAVIGALTYAGAKSPLVNPVVEKDPQVAQGERLYRQLSCSYCHSIRGKGGLIGPELDKVVGQKSDEWLIKHFRDPQALVPNSRMPKLNLLDDEITVLTAYMKSIGIQPFTKEAPKLFTENCAVCHMINGVGADTASDLSLIGSAQDKAYIKRYIIDPTKLNAKSSMPTFQGLLTDVQIEDLSRYLSSLGR